uniref:Uncharacterized protein n=1 Tax=Anguilla anguilla TaxID=7936 RepID=A0A0E9QP47_ANGAN
MWTNLDLRLIKRIFPCKLSLVFS